MRLPGWILLLPFDRDSETFLRPPVVFAFESLFRHNVMYRPEPQPRSSGDKARSPGYRRVPYAPKKKGEMRLSPSALEIYLNDFMAPHGNRKAFPVKISLVKSAIDSMVNLETGDPVPFWNLNLRN
jgi:hypothetical protein